ncbi:hypothetical protein FIBSPDRAFT_867745, partial [Athelia psychrophila]
MHGLRVRQSPASVRPQQPTNDTATGLGDTSPIVRKCLSWKVREKKSGQMSGGAFPGHSPGR